MSTGIRSTGVRSTGVGEQVCEYRCLSTGCNVPFVYPTLLSYRGQGSSAALHITEYTDGRVSVPSRG